MFIAVIVLFSGGCPEIILKLLLFYCLRRTNVPPPHLPPVLGRQTFGALLPGRLLLRGARGRRRRPMGAPGRPPVTVVEGCPRTGACSAAARMITGPETQYRSR